jgi:hypothetical protein
MEFDPALLDRQKDESSPDGIQSETIGRRRVEKAIDQ